MLCDSQKSECDSFSCCLEFRCYAFAASPVLAEDRCGIDAQMAAALDRANKNDEDIIEKVRKEVNESIKKADVKDKNAWHR